MQSRQSKNTVHSKAYGLPSNASLVVIPGAAVAMTLYLDYIIITQKDAKFCVFFVSVVSYKRLTIHTQNVCFYTRFSSKVQANCTEENRQNLYTLSLCIRYCLFGKYLLCEVANLQSLLKCLNMSDFVTLRNFATSQVGGFFLKI